MIEFRLDLRGEFALYEAYLKDNKLRAPTPGDLAFPELASRLMTLRMGLVRRGFKGGCMRCHATARLTSARSHRRWAS